MAAAYTEVTNESWFSRIGGAFKGIIIGLILFGLSFVLLFWNEGRAVKQYKALEEGGNNVVSVAVEKVDPANEEKLIHLTGQTVIGEELKDPVFGISAKALKLKRTVEIYLWEESEHSETKKKLGGGTETKTTYSYTKSWSGSLIDSSKFKDPAAPENPSSMPYSSDNWQVKKVELGAFVLSPSLIGMINNYETLSVGHGDPMPEGIKVVNGTHFIGSDPANPAVGDLRITFAAIKPLEVSVVSQQKGQSFVPYTASNGRSVELLQAGQHTAEAMFQKAVADNNALTWILRVVGFFLMMIGLNMIFKLASVLADVIPILGNIIGAGTGIIAFLLAACLSLVTIAIAWVFYRPVLGVSLLAVAVVLIFLIGKKLKGKAVA